MLGKGFCSFTFTGKTLEGINDIAEMKNCHNTMHFRAQGSDQFLYLSKSQVGPTIVFKLSNGKFIMKIKW